MAQKGCIKNRVGERKLMNCGQYAEIIKYINSDNIDVLFDDGYVAYGKCYCHFKNGKIKSRLNESNRLGETLTMNCGLMAKIIKYNNSQDIDIEFEDGFVYKNQCYNHFKNRRLESKLKYINRVGETQIMNSGEMAKITEYNNAKNITVEFNNGCILKNITYDQFKNKTLTTIYSITNEGVGYLGDANPKDEEGNTKKAYVSWNNMLKRSYNNDFKTKHTTYKDVYVCDEWHSYENFEKWYDVNYYELENETMHLDKDILVKGNKVYSPDTCVYAPQRINTLFVKSDGLRGDLPIGVFLNGNKYYARWYEYCKSKHTTVVSTIEEAFALYKLNKENHIKRVADEYKDKISKKLYDAMYNYQVEITD